MLFNAFNIIPKHKFKTIRYVEYVKRVLSSFIQENINRW